MIKKSKEKASIHAPVKPFEVRAGYVSPEPEEELEPGAVRATQAPLGSRPAEVETFQLRPDDIESWNPRLHSFEGEVLLYEPGIKLVYEHHKDMAPIVARLLGALVLGWLVGLFFEHIQWSVTAALSLVGFVELFRWKTGVYESTRWEWNWRRDSLQEIVGEERFEYRFTEVDEVVLRLTKREHQWSSLLSGSRKQNRFYSFCAHTLISGPDDATFEVARTGDLQQHPDEVKYIGLCFAFMLAQQLNVPLCIQELPTPE